ncbi:hypothetical protein ACJRO7_017724 [Eucalyptus globulus]|uniref:Yippee domain-containing protein n=1 Tax=Eucalyptus globulus TaxID=34317 RepID=A0ABD3KSC2_EUCGL
MGRLYIQHLSGEKIYKCKFCRVDSASHDDIISKEFFGRFGRAYLMRNVVNISIGPKEQRQLSSGLHTVNDIYCSSCQQLLGWRYVSFNFLFYVMVLDASACSIMHETSPCGGRDYLMCSELQEI